MFLKCGVHVVEIIVVTIMILIDIIEHIMIIITTDFAKDSKIIKRSQTNSQQHQEQQQEQQQHIEKKSLEILKSIRKRFHHEVLQKTAVYITIDLKSTIEFAIDCTTG